MLMLDSRFRTLIAGTALVTLAASGCATIPSEGLVQSTPPAIGGAGSACCGLIVNGPQRGWSPQQVVSGFLLASAIFAHHHAIARQYLTPAASRSWQPRSAVTILAQAPEVYQQGGHLTGPGSRAVVVVAGQKLATLSRSGQYIPLARGDAASTAPRFALELVNGRYLIDGLPGTGTGKIVNELLLPNYLFHLVYTPRDLYYSLRDGTLVPNPVFVPAEGPSPAATLIGDLLHDPSGWLRGAARTAFPAKAWLRKVQVLPGPQGGKTATVDIGLPPGAPRTNLRGMAAQLVVTLTSPAYSSPLFQAVKLKLNGRPWPARQGGPVQRLADYTRSIPHLSRYAPVYYLTPSGAVRMLSRLAARGIAVHVHGDAGTGDLPLSKVAVSAAGRYLAGIAGPATTVYTCDLGDASRSKARAADGKLRARLTGSYFTSLSWDRVGRLWLSGRVHRSSGVWEMPSVQGAPRRVQLPPGLGPVTALRVAPDGVRVAMIAGRGSASHLTLGAIVHDSTGFSITHPVPLGPGLTDVSALTWFDTDHVLAVTKSELVTHLWNVPADGDGAASLGALAGMVSITAAGPLNPLYLGLKTGRLEKSVGINEPWTDVADGHAATYSG